MRAAAFADHPDIHVAVEDMLVDSDRVAVRSVLRGLSNSVPAGAEPAASMLDIFRVQHGLIAEHPPAGRERVTLTSGVEAPPATAQSCSDIFRSSIYSRRVTRQNPSLTEPQYFILAALMDGPLHGYGIIKAAEQATDGRLRIAVGTLYGALERMERAGLVAAGHEEIVDGRARRYYKLTEDGTAMLSREALRMQQAAAVVIGRSRNAGAAPA
ncbi:ParR family transcriptional regulator [Streptomyces sparsogenes DSM 40356]|uniref:ParR family transcriptional regulator n=1 Tax=Streptomyces sparsogenes DSM 40356 TaxID=1331668 RepID=A0A1R1SLD3_9ACTN|nr:ParR family transcriptional regulator [Streptomyces sparsogenes DSM 40356]